MATEDLAVLEQQEYIYPEEENYAPTIDGGSGGSSFLFTFLKSLKIGSDLSRMSTPVNIEKGKSGLEVACDVARPTEEVLTIHKTTDPEQRMLKVFKYLLAPMSMIPKPSLAVAEKPFNSLLGEEFHCLWNHSDGSQTFGVCEQISHHPPISCTYIYNARNNFAYLSTTRGAPSFLGNKLEIKSIGPTSVTIFLPDNTREVYNVTKPAFAAKGLLIGKACFELGKELIVECEQTRLCASVSFKSGSVVKGEITLNKKTIYKIEGSIVGQIYISDCRTKDAKKLFIDTHCLSDLQKVVKPVVKQTEMESRRAWHHVTFAIKSGDLELAAKLKSEIEEKQRQRIKEMKGDYIPKYFKANGITVDKVQGYDYIHPLTKYTPPNDATTVDDELD